MTPILYDSSEQDFTSLGFGALGDAISCVVYTVLNGIFELEMTYPTSGLRYKELQISRIIKAVSEKNGNPQLFDIYAITKPISGVVTVYAFHVSGRKQFVPIMPCLATGIVDALNVIPTKAAENFPFTFWTNKTTSGNFILKHPASLGQVLGGMEGSLLDVYRGEYEFDNFTIKIWSRRGQDNGVTLRYGKNITSIEQEESIASTITGICPFWADFEGNTVVLSEKTVDSPNASNFPFKRTVVKDFSLAFDEQPTEAQLRSYTQAYILANNIGVPEVGIDVSYENLADYEEYSGMQLLEQIRLGDTVHVYFEPLDITAEARAVETRYDVLADKYVKIRIGSVKANLSKTINAIADETNEAIAQSTSSTASMLEEAFMQALALFSGIEGGSILYRTNDVTGKPYEILLLDTGDINTAQKIVRLNSAGIAISKTGMNGPWTVAMTGEGIVADTITAGTLQGIQVIANVGSIGGWEINGYGLYKTIADPLDTNKQYRVTIYTPDTTTPGTSPVLDFQMSSDGGQSFYPTFSINGNGSQIVYCENAWTADRPVFSFVNKSDPTHKRTMINDKAMSVWDMAGNVQYMSQFGSNGLIVNSGGKTRSQYSGIDGIKQFRYDNNNNYIGAGLWLNQLQGLKFFDENNDLVASYPNSGWVGKNVTDSYANGGTTTWKYLRNGKHIMAVCRRVFTNVSVNYQWGGIWCGYSSQNYPNGGDCNFKTIAYPVIFNDAPTVIAQVEGINGANDGWLVSNIRWTQSNKKQWLPAYDLARGGSQSTTISEIAICYIVFGVAAELYTITRTLSNVTSSNTYNSIYENNQYVTTLTLADGYVMDSVTVTMGGIDVTSDYYDSETNVITIPDVNGNIVIIASAVEPPESEPDDDVPEGD